MNRHSCSSLIRALTATRKLALLKRFKVVGVALTSSVDEEFAGARGRVVVVAGDAGPARTDFLRQLADWIEGHCNIFGTAEDEHSRF